MASKFSIGALRWAFNNPRETAFRQTLRATNRLFAWSAGGEGRPAFFDVDKTCPALRLLDHNYQIIRDELEAVLSEKHRIPRYHELSEREILISGTVNPEKDWRVFMLTTVAGIPPSKSSEVSTNYRSSRSNSRPVSSILLNTRPRKAYPGSLRTLPRLSAIPFGFTNSEK